MTLDANSLPHTYTNVCVGCGDAQFQTFDRGIGPLPSGFIAVIKGRIQGKGPSAAGPPQCLWAPADAS